MQAVRIAAAKLTKELAKFIEVGTRAGGASVEMVAEGLLGGSTCCTAMRQVMFPLRPFECMCGQLVACVSTASTHSWVDPSTLCLTPSTLPFPVPQAKGDARSTWRHAVQQTMPWVGFSPSTVMLSAYSYFEGKKMDGAPVKYRYVCACVCGLVSGAHTVLYRGMCEGGAGAACEGRIKHGTAIKNMFLPPLYVYVWC